MPIHPKVYGSAVGALLGTLGTTILAQCGGWGAILSIALPVVLGAAGGWLTPSPAPAGAPPVTLIPPPAA